MQSQMKLTFIFFSHYQFKFFYIVTTCEFSICYRFKYLQIMRKFIALARLGIILAIIREMTRKKWVYWE